RHLKAALSAIRQRRARQIERQFGAQRFVAHEGFLCGGRAGEQGSNRRCGQQIPNGHQVPPDPSYRRGGRLSALRTLPETAPPTRILWPLPPGRLSGCRSAASVRCTMGLADHMTEQSPEIGRPNIDVSAAPAETAADMPLLRIEAVSKNFGSFRAVDRLSLDIGAGEFFALLGPSGCGKTTLLRMLAGFETPDEGRILLGGRDIAQVLPHERPVNMMFQNYALFPHLSVRDNIAFGLRRAGM